MPTTATRSSLDEEMNEGSSRLESTTAAVSDAASAVRDAASDAASRIPDVAATTRAAFEDANRRIQSSTDEMLTVGTAVSFGFAIGLLLGGASRILVAAALAPVAMMGLTLLDRASQARTAGRSGSAERAGL